MRPPGSLNPERQNCRDAALACKGQTCQVRKPRLPHNHAFTRKQDLEPKENEYQLENLSWHIDFEGYLFFPLRKALHSFSQLRWKRHDHFRCRLREGVIQQYIRFMSLLLDRFFQRGTLPCSLSGFQAFAVLSFLFLPGGIVLFARARCLR